jgi:hypothetical protein
LTVERLVRCDNNVGATCILQGALIYSYMEGGLRGAVLRAAQRASVPSCAYLQIKVYARSNAGEPAPATMRVSFHFHS